MQSHDDFDSNKILDEFRKVAERMTACGEHLITAGAPRETSLVERLTGGFVIWQMADHPPALRISIGEAHEKRLGESAYMVFRGDREMVLALLRRALGAMEARPP